MISGTSEIAGEQNELGRDLLTVSKGTCTSFRLLDSSCSVHLYFKRDYFEAFQGIEAGIVSLGDGSACNVTRFGTVKIEWFDGIVRILGGVTDAPKIRWSLISIGQFDSKGGGIFAAGEVMKITHGRLVLMKEEKCKGFYHLVRNTEINVSKISNGSWKWRTDGEYSRGASFAVGAKTHVDNFHGSDDGKVVTESQVERIVRDPSPRLTG